MRDSSSRNQKVHSYKLELYFSCRKLPDLDLVTVTDSFLVCQLSARGQPFKEVLRTKVYWNDLDPDYAETLVMDYEYEGRQVLRVEVWHQERPEVLVGSAEVSLCEIHNARVPKLSLPLQGGKTARCGELHILWERPRTINVVSFDLRARRVPSRSCGFLECLGLCPPIPFVRLRKHLGGERLLIYESEPFQGPERQNPLFQDIRMSKDKFCSSNPGQPLSCEILDYSENGKHAELGRFDFTLEWINHSNVFRLGNSECEVIFERFRDRPEFTCDMYLDAGMELALDVFVDFTDSNRGPPNLHDTSTSQPSSYEKALGSVVKVLAKEVPTLGQHVGMYGFGANLKQTELKKSFCPCFKLCQNAVPLGDILGAYRKAMPWLEFGLEGTYFAPILEQSMHKARELPPNRYLLVLILTDGDLCDFLSVCDLLVGCSRLPLSVTIVGLGKGDFSLMRRLDDNDMLMLDSQGRRTERDLVTFVEYDSLPQGQLTHEVMKELPRQILDYCRLVGLQPSSIVAKPGTPNREQMVRFMEKLESMMKGGSQESEPKTHTAATIHSVRSELW